MWCSEYFASTNFRDLSMTKIFIFAKKTKTDSRKNLYVYNFRNLSMTEILIFAKNKKTDSRKKIIRRLRFKRI